MIPRAKFRVRAADVEWEGDGVTQIRQRTADVHVPVCMAHFFMTALII